jgi:Clp amino terminal domain, pathogenicity island component
VDAFERFSDEAKRTLTLTQAEAERSRSAYIGTEHILLGMLRTGDSQAAAVLAGLGVDLAGARSAIGAIPRRPDQPLSAGGSGGAPTSRVRRVIELAFQEARARGDTAVTTGSMLLGLLQVADGAAAEVLQGSGVSVVAVREALDRLGEQGLVETLSGGEPAGAGALVAPGRDASGAATAGSASPSPAATPPQASELRVLLDSAEREAAAMGTTAGPDHLLRALLAGDAFTARVLGRLGVDPAEALRAATAPADARELGEEVRRLRSELEGALAAGDDELAAVAHQREAELRRRLEERLRRWRDTLE